MNTAADVVLRAPPRQTLRRRARALSPRPTRHPKPAGWTLSPRAVRSFILGDPKLGVRRKFFGDDALIDRCVVTLMSNRGLLLVGEPGTAKSMLSELLAAAISGRLDLHHPGHGGHHRGPDQVLAGTTRCCSPKGPSPRALVRGPLHRGDAATGRLCRFEEITRCSRRSRTA